MKPVGEVRNAAEHDRKCYACRWLYGPHWPYLLDLKPSAVAARSVQLYELAVETIEGRAGRGPFTRREVWRQAGGGPSLHNTFGYALHDMRMHGLIICVKITAHKKCHLWEVVAR